MIFSRHELGTYEHGAGRQWLISNGLGGYASSTVSGANTSKYHGLLFASLKPPVERTLLLAKLEEEITVHGETYRLGTNRVAGGVYPEGFRYLQAFQLRPFPTYVFAIRDILLEKTVFMIREANITIVRYVLLGAEGTQARISVTPLINCRHYHHTVRKNDWPFHRQEKDREVMIEAYPGSPKLRLSSDRAVWRGGPGWWFEGLFYQTEAERGLDPWEDHFMPGHFEAELTAGQAFSIVASAPGERDVNNPYLEQVSAERRLAHLIETAGFHEEFINRLILAADTFIVKRRSTGAKTIIAGYPWFTDWGRDSMIALPGLTLVTGRLAEAKEILQTFAEYCQDGLIPNMFPDEGAPPLYNTVDASLWFIQAVYKYLEYSGDDSFIKNSLYPVMRDIVENYRLGTRFNIGMEEDGLISAGEAGTQLTWMDAKAGDWVVTPRHGKPVEINALWYNALEIMHRLAQKYEDTGTDYSRLAARVRSGFVSKFWNREKNCLFDLIGEDGPDAAVRPNQIFAVSLPFSPLDHAKQVQVVNRVWRDLYFSFGLRSLSQKSPAYHGQYRGSQVERDAAYHQGTGWAWLTGPFITAYCKVNDYSPDSKVVAERFIAPFRAHLRDHGVNTISEIFDGDSPHEPRGCFSQAWSVAEVLRAYVEDVLGIGPHS